MEETGIKKSSAIGTIIKALLYVIMYVAIQIAVTIAYGIKLTIDYLIINGIETSKNEEEVMRYVTENINTNVILIITTLMTFVVLLVIMLAKHEKFKVFFSINKLNIKVIPILVLLGIGMNLFFSGILSLIAEIPGITETVQEYGDQSIQLIEENAILNVIVLAILVPILEEIVFRVLPLNKMIPRISPIVAVILTSLVFGISHGNIIWAIYTFIFGAVLAVVFLKYKSSLANMIIHSVFNLISVILAVLPIEVEDGTKIPIIFVAAGTIILIIAVLLYKYINKKLLESN